MLSLPPHIKALVFDAYGTLFDVQSLDQRLEMHFGKQATAINAIWRQKQLQYTWLRSLMGRYVSFSTVTAEALTFACQELGIVLREKVKQHIVQGYYELRAYPELKNGLGELKKHYRLAILSNADPAMLESAATHNGIEPFFEAILSVDSIRQFKPIPAVYELAPKALNLSAAEIAFVSSNTWDVCGAKSFGLFSIWLNRNKATMDELGYAPDIEINRLESLV